MHTFFQDVSFLDCLNVAINTANTSSPGRFLEFKSCNGCYAINLDCINYVNISDEVYEISSDDSPGCSVFLVGRDEPIELGELSPEQVFESLADQDIQFIRRGSYYFKRDEVALIVLNGRKSS